jgi:hypothetical protein
VVRFSAESDVQRGFIEGRVEHVASGEKAGFGSLDELWAFVRGLLVRGTVPNDPRAISQPMAPAPDDKLGILSEPHRSHARPEGTNPNPQRRER